MKFSLETKIIAGVFLVTLFIITGAVFIGSGSEKVYSNKEVMGASTSYKGNNKALIVLVEFADYQCPACGFFKKEVDKIMKKHDGKINFVYRNFPFQGHNLAYLAAQASLASSKQGKYWEAYNYLYTNQDRLSEELIRNIYQPLKLDKNKFENDLDSKEVKDVIIQDVQDGEKFGIDATPTFFLNGRKLAIYEPVDLTSAVDRAVANLK